MKPEEIRYLLGGYASGTLSEEEKRVLFAAALEDQALFDELGDEQALKDVFDDPESRGYLREALEEDRRETRPVVVAAPAPMAAAATAPSTTARSRGTAKPGVPAARWGLLTAAVLAAVTIVGVLQMNRNPVREVAENRTSSLPAPAPSRPQEGAAGRSPAREQPVRARAKSKTVETPRAAKEASGEAMKAPAIPVEQAPQVADAKPGAPAPAAAPQPVVAVTAAVPPPLPLQAESDAAGGSRAAQLKTSPAPALPPGTQFQGSVTGIQQRAARREEALAKKADAANAHVLGYRLLLRRSGSSGAEFVPVALTATMSRGDEVELEVLRLAGIKVEIRRGGSDEAVPLALKTAGVVRTAPLKLEGAGIEFVIAVSREEKPAIAAVPLSVLLPARDQLTYVDVPSSGELAVRVPVRLR